MPGLFEKGGLAIASYLDGKPKKATDGKQEVPVAETSLSDRDQDALDGVAEGGSDSVPLRSPEEVQIRLDALNVTNHYREKLFPKLAALVKGEPVAAIFFAMGVANAINAYTEGQPQILKNQVRLGSGKLVDALVSDSKVANEIKGYLPELWV